MKLFIILLLFVLSPFMDEEKKIIPYVGQTQWFDSTGAQVQYEEDTVYSYIDSPLYVIDSGIHYPVLEFDFVYKELAVYENAEGKPALMVDIKSTTITGDRLDTAWSRTLKDRLAWGDTLIFTDVKFSKNNQNFLAKPLKVFMYMPPKLRK